MESSIHLVAEHNFTPEALEVARAILPGASSLVSAPWGGRSSIEPSLTFPISRPIRDTIRRLHRRSVLEAS